MPRTLDRSRHHEAPHDTHEVFEPGPGLATRAAPTRKAVGPRTGKAPVSVAGRDKWGKSHASFCGCWSSAALLRSAIAHVRDAALNPTGKPPRPPRQERATQGSRMPCGWTRPLRLACSNADRQPCPAHGVSPRRSPGNTARGNAPSRAIPCATAGPARGAGQRPVRQRNSAAARPAACDPPPSRPRDVAHPCIRVRCPAAAIRRGGALGRSLGTDPACRRHGAASAPEVAADSTSRHATSPPRHAGKRLATHTATGSAAPVTTGLPRPLLAPRSSAVTLCDSRGSDGARRLPLQAHSRQLNAYMRFARWRWKYFRTSSRRLGSHPTASSRTGTFAASSSAKPPMMLLALHRLPRPRQDPAGLVRTSGCSPPER